jgi:hypothetical protein
LQKRAIKKFSTIYQTTFFFARIITFSCTFHWGRCPLLLFFGRHCWLFLSPAPFHTSVIQPDLSLSPLPFLVAVMRQVSVVHPRFKTRLIPALKTALPRGPPARKLALFITPIIFSILLLLTGQRHSQEINYFSFSFNVCTVYVQQ